MNPIGARIFSSIFILIGGITLFLGVKSLVAAKASETWPTAQGKIVSSSVDSKRGSKGGTTYHAEVLYEYSVAGQLQSSHNVAFGSYGSNDPSHARSIVNRYPAGSVVTVHYLPADPGKSVFEPGISGKTFLLPAFGALFSFAGVAMFIFIPRAIERRRVADVLPNSRLVNNE